MRTIAPETEADPAALLIDFLVSFGNAVGPGPHAFADGAKHPARLFSVIVGDTARARKGTSRQQVARLMARVDDPWSSERVIGGLSSGEGLIRAAAEGGDSEKKRLLVFEAEFGRLLTVAKREGNVASAVIREAYDTGDLRVMTKEPLVATGVHISLIGHITSTELLSSIDSIAATNGFANRFLFVCAQRSKFLPSGGNLDEEEVTYLAAKVRAALEAAGTRTRVRRTREADLRWNSVYEQLGRDGEGEGMLDGLLTRAQAQVLRLSLVFSLLDEGARHIDLEHLESALAVWQYCRDSAAYLFGGRLGDPLAERVVALLRDSPGASMTRSDLQRQANAHGPAKKLDQVLETLEARGLVTQLVLRGKGGRPGTQVYLR